MDRTTCEHFTPASLPCDECVDLKSCACSDCNQEVLQLRDELAQANGYLKMNNDLASASSVDANVRPLDCRVSQ